MGSRGHPWPRGLQAGDGHGPHLVEVATACVDGHAACFPGDPESFPPPAWGPASSRQPGVTQLGGGCEMQSLDLRMFFNIKSWEWKFKQQNKVI